MSVIAYTARGVAGSPTALSGTVTRCFSIAEAFSLSLSLSWRGFGPVGLLLSSVAVV